MKVTLEDGFFLFYRLHLNEYQSHITFRANIESVSSYKPLLIATRFQDLVRIFENSVKSHRRFKHLCHRYSKRLSKEYDRFEKENGPFGYISPQKIRTIVTFNRKRGSSDMFCIREEYIQEVFLGEIKDKFHSKAHLLTYTPGKLKV